MPMIRRLRAVGRACTSNTQQLVRRVWGDCSGVAWLLCRACVVSGTEWPPGSWGRGLQAGLPVLQACTPPACCLPEPSKPRRCKALGRMLESAAKPCPQLERQQEVSVCGATMASWTLAACSSCLQPAARASAPVLSVRGAQAAELEDLHAPPGRLHAALPPTDLQTRPPTPAPQAMLVCTAAGLAAAVGGPLLLRSALGSPALEAPRQALPQPLVACKAAWLTA